MKITILKEKLKTGINIVERAVSKSLGLPILNNILIAAEKNFLNLIATDLEMGIKWQSLAKTEEIGRIAVPSRVLSSFVNFLPDKPIILETKQTSLKVICGNYQTLIKGFNPEEFPLLPVISAEEKISVQSNVFCQGLGMVNNIASYSSTKPEISGIYFLFQKNLITLVATDSFRLGEKKIYLSPGAVNLSKDYSFILPQRTAKEIINIFGEKQGEKQREKQREKQEGLSIVFSPNQVLFESPSAQTAAAFPQTPQTQIVSRLIEGDYPAYQEIIPKKYNVRLFFQKKEMINQIKLASLFSGKNNEVKIKIDSSKNRLEVFSQSPETGEHYGFLPVKIEGSFKEISFNYRFLLDGLLSLASSSLEKEDEAVLELSGPEKPGILRAKGDDKYLYLAMPIKS
ncbi:MAG: DNA polymerase III subunit beta [Candidatus Nealsonbacteria bacterium]|nr:DNA polymerase III subunit beta [Candidatus Nealsonbacteria bacterium]